VTVYLDTEGDAGADIALTCDPPPPPNGVPSPSPTFTLRRASAPGLFDILVHTGTADASDSALRLEVPWVAVAGSPA
jgi:hypothetical protein